MDTKGEQSLSVPHHNSKSLLKQPLAPPQSWFCLCKALLLLVCRRLPLGREDDPSQSLVFPGPRQAHQVISCVVGGPGGRGWVI